MCYNINESAKKSELKVEKNVNVLRASLIRLNLSSKPKLSGTVWGSCATELFAVSNVVAKIVFTANCTLISSQVATSMTGVSVKHKRSTLPKLCSAVCTGMIPET